MDIRDLKGVYFIGAGGIGMSALIRYFLAKGKKTAGYDRTPSALTDRLIEDGAALHFEEDETLIPDDFRDKKTTLIVYTPAVPASHRELVYFRNNGFEILKRSQTLGLITESSRGLCIAGTHGKTTTSSMTAHLLKQSKVDCNAFLGGILKNCDSNLMLSDSSDLTVVEADEYDRSFHYLNPYMAVVTSADPDHLDIYGSPKAYRESFEKFTSLVRTGGVLIMKKGIDITPDLQPDVKTYTYSATDKTADFHAENVRIGNGEIFFDFVSPTVTVKNVQLGIPIKINIENGMAAMALASLNGVTGDEMLPAMKSFAGAERRFDFLIKSEKTVYIDDYAHHPQELESSIQSVKELYEGRKLTGIFQPHLYTRTRDFADEFAASLSALDRLILLDIYPAREEPIPGVTSEIIFDKVTVKDKILCKKDELMSIVENEDFDVLMTLGAGDIDRFTEPIRLLLEKRINI
ncbi:MAG: UDP-N-acetylmuramate--L-alanine ligase [Tannerella sp.]|jgi:UDP-N-acetylmuramate--alanine ligase|nr:UDP-N-acetylmuramate--L-alanine ligase [Tannerella sp.]